MSLKIADIFNTISGLTISGVKIIYDLDEIPLGIDGRNLPALIPDPNRPVSNFDMEIVSMGAASQAKLNASYTINFMLIYGQVGKGRTNKIEAISELYDLAIATVDVITSTDSINGCDVFVPVIGEIGVVTVGNLSYNQLPISLNINEIVR